MEPKRTASRLTFMLADTSDIHALGVAQHRHATDLAAVAVDLRSAQIDPDAFGSAGAGFLVALNTALAREAGHAIALAERLTAARITSEHAATAYTATEHHVAQAISSLRA